MKKETRGTVIMILNVVIMVANYLINLLSSNIDNANKVAEIATKIIVG